MEIKPLKSPLVQPASYPVEIKILFDPRTGNTELQVRNTGMIAVDMIKVAGLLTAHASSVIDSLINRNLKMQPIADVEKPNAT